MPSTNNALESTNNSIKRTHTMRERFTLSVFLGKLFNMLNCWSVDRKMEVKSFQKFTEPTDILWKLIDEYIATKPIIKCPEKRGKIFF